jgi:hypothetical protein
LLFVKKPKEIGISGSTKIVNAKSISIKVAITYNPNKIDKYPFVLNFDKLEKI